MSKELYSDLYKDVNGFRPSIDRIKIINEMSESDFDKEYTTLVEMLRKNELNDMINRSKACSDWNIYINKMMKMFNIDWATAIKWDMEAEKATEDFDYYLYFKGF